MALRYFGTFQIPWLTVKVKSFEVLEQSGEDIKKSWEDGECIQLKAKSLLLVEVEQDSM